MPKKKKKKKRRKRRLPAPSIERPPLAEQPYTIDEGITQSLLSSFVDCRVRTKLHLDGWRLARTKESLYYGSLFHHLLEHLGKGVRSGETDADAYACDSKWCGTGIAGFRATQDAGADASSLQLTENCIAQAIGVWDGYLSRYPDDFAADRWLELEGTFDATWNGYRLRGKRDGMLRDSKGNLWLFETKTKSQISEDTVSNTLAFDFQSLFYLTANQAELEARGEKAKLVGVVYNVVRKPQHKQKAGESLQDYSARIAADVEKRPDHWFFRYEARYGGRALAEFQRQLAEKLFAFDSWLKPSSRTASGAAIATYRNEAACIKRWHCPYISFCAGSQEDYEKTGRLFVELED